MAEGLGKGAARTHLVYNTNGGSFQIYAGPIPAHTVQLSRPVRSDRSPAYSPLWRRRDACPHIDKIKAITCKLPSSRAKLSPSRRGPQCAVTLGCSEWCYQRRCRGDPTHSYRRRHLRCGRCLLRSLLKDENHLESGDCHNWVRHFTGERRTRRHGWGQRTAASA